jgi:hypothetical protein
MLHYFFIGMTWLIGAVGVGGAIATIVGLVTLGPAAVVAWFEPLLVKFLSCLWCVVAVVFLLSTVAAYWVGHHTAEGESRAAELAAELRNKQIDLDNATKAASDESTRANTIEAQANDQHAKDETYIAELKNRPDPACALDDSDLPVGVRVPKPRARSAKPAAGAR